MRILFVAPRQCWPRVSGAKLREFHLARALGLDNEVTYLYFQEPGLKPNSPEDFPFCRELIGIPWPAPYSWGKLMRGIVGRWPLPVLNYTSEAMTRAISNAASAQSFDLVHLDGIQLAGYQSQLERELPGAQIVYDWHNIESELMRRYSQTEASIRKSRYAAITSLKLASLEKRLLQSRCGHIVCSEREKQRLLARVPGARVQVVENGVDTDFFSQVVVENGERNRVLFVGAMAYHANIDAVVHFAREIWPRIYERFPRFRLTLVGSNPTPDVLALRECPGVEVTGTVPDVRPYYRDAVAAIVPVRSGSGTRLKILEAIVAGVPVISTTLGAEGLDVQAGRELLIADGTEQWIAALESLDGRSALREELVRAGREFIANRYDWNAVGCTLRETYREWVAMGDRR